MSGLETSNLNVGYSPDKILLQDLSVSINAGDFIGLVGQNGVGKSTLIRTLSGLHPPLNGEIRINNASILELTQRQIAKSLSVVLTGKPESLNLTVTELIALGRYPYSGWLGTLKPEDITIIDSSITQMEINYIANKRLFELSDGQLQKVMIARALAQDTEIIILDEPTSHLDLKNKIEVLELLKKIADSGKGVLISTHEIQLTSQVCKSYWCVDFGQPLVVGTPKEMVQTGVLHDYLHLPKTLEL